MLVGGIALLVVAAIAAVIVYTTRNRQRAYEATERSPVGELDQLAKSVSAEAGTGSFRQTVEVDGRAQPAGAEPLKAPISGQECLWYRATVTHRSWSNETVHVGEDQREERRESSSVVSDETSSSPFVVDDGTGRIVIDPRGADVDEPEVGYDRFEPNDGPGQSGTRISGFGVSMETGGDGGSLGFHKRELLIRPGQVLYVLGEARDSSGTLEIGEPADRGRFVISTRTEEQLAAGAGRTASIATAVAAIAGVPGLVLVVLGALS